jgi:hypothetical protein
LVDGVGVAVVELGELFKGLAGFGGSVPVAGELLGDPVPGVDVADLFQRPAGPVGGLMYCLPPRMLLTRSGMGGPTVGVVSAAAGASVMA